MLKLLNMILGRRRAFDARAYWENRYRRGGTSGAGSEGALADYKARFVNDFVAEHRIDSVIEFGCGDGRQLEGMRYPRYLGLAWSRVLLGIDSRLPCDGVIGSPWKSLRSIWPGVRS